jgi:hypothetical protein
VIKPAGLPAVRIVANADNPNGKVLDAATGELVPMLDRATVHLSATRPPFVDLNCLVLQALRPTHTHAVHDVDITVDGECITWHGLENVPAVALRAELARREAAHPPEVTG